MATALAKITDRLFCNYWL